MFHDKNTAAPIKGAGWLPKTFSQIDHGNNLAAQVDYPFEIRRCIGNGGDLRDAHDLMQGSDRDAVGFPSNLESNDMGLAAHGDIPSESPPSRIWLPGRSREDCRWCGRCAARSGPSNQACLLYT